MCATLPARVTARACRAAAACKLHAAGWKPSAARVASAQVRLMVHGEDTVLGDAAGNSELFVTAETHVGRALLLLQALQPVHHLSHLLARLLWHCSTPGPLRSCKQPMTALVRPAADLTISPLPAPATRDGEGGP